MHPHAVGSWAMFRRVLAAVTTLAIAAALLMLFWPQLFSLELVPGVAHAVSLRGVLVAGALLGALLLTLLALLFRASRRFFSSIAVLLLLFALATTAVLATRGIGSPAFQDKAEADVVVLAWNTLGDAPGLTAVAELTVENDADAIALIETSREFADALAADLAARGADYQVLQIQFDAISKARSTALLVSTRLGEYEIDADAGSTGVVPSLVARPSDGSGPSFVAAHPVAPIPRLFETWRDDLSWVAAQCVNDTIVLGDLNSTLDHFHSLRSPDVDGSDLGECVDGARATGNAAVGTWPTSVPALLGAPIDRVLATRNWEFVGFRVIGSLDGSGSDHRPVLAQLRPVAGSR